MLWVVAGCLFEVSLARKDGPWRWLGPNPAVTLVAEEDREDDHHFRFRAEVPGDVALSFAAAGATASVRVRIAPERLA